MTESISIAKALHTFFSTLPNPAANQSVPTLNVIAEKYSVATNSTEFYEIVHIQRGNLLALTRRLDAADWPKETKRASRQHVDALLQAVDHIGLIKDWRETHQKLVKPNLSSLLLLEQSLHIENCLDDEAEEDIKKLLLRFESLFEDVENADLPTELRGKIIAALSVLVLLLRNYKVVGLSRAWEVASSTLVTLSLEAKATPENNAGIVRKVIKTFAVGTAILAAANGFLDDSTKLLSKITGVFQSIGSVIGDEPKLLEHHAEQRSETSLNSEATE
jgi:hypothetical protein